MQRNTAKYHGDIPDILVEEDVTCPSVHYFKHRLASE
jgi:hypothetical protein